MNAPQTLRKPSNWQDFEALIKKLWGEIWNCPDIRKNGRNGDKQNGVDVYGIPEWEDAYYGIQCKGKDEYTDKQFTENGIRGEIEKAKTFQPPLKKLYFTTTAVKNSTIEECVRKININHLNNGLFGVELYCWEDIVDLIDENKKTYDWYVKNQKYKTLQGISVTFQDRTIGLTVNPKFKQQITHFTQKTLSERPIVNPFASSLQFSEQILKLSPWQNQLVKPTEIKGINKTINLSYFPIRFLVHNTGTAPIEEYKLYFDFQGDIKDIADSNVIKSIFPDIKFKYTTFINKENHIVTIKPSNKVLVGDDVISSDDIFILTQPIDAKIIINWKLLSKDFKDNGQLKIYIKPEIEREYNTVLVEDPLKEEVKEYEIEEYIEYKTDD
jgi:hypothetical protein